MRRDAITVMVVPGAFELPLAATALAKTRRFACIVALGCVIRGDTPHFDYVASEAASGLQLAALETGVPVSFGVLTLDRIEQARSSDREGFRSRSNGARDGGRLLPPARGRVALSSTRRPGWDAPVHCSAACPRSVRSAGRSPASATTEATRWWPRSAASTRTCNAYACSSTVERRARTSARAASRPARSKRPSDALPLDG